jgi:hypothetical protein
MEARTRLLGENYEPSWISNQADDISVLHGEDEN